MRLFITLLLFILIVPVSAQVKSSVETPEIGIRIPLGEAVTIKGITIKFMEVLEDSRCPLDVTCVWEGRAMVKVLVSKKDEELYEAEVVLGKVFRNEGGLTNCVYFDADCKIEAIGLTPYPEKQFEKKDPYVLIVREVEKS